MSSGLPNAVLVGLSGLLLGFLAAVMFDHWLVEGDSLVAPLLGAVVAFIAAFVAYPWQKSLDRKAQLIAAQDGAFVQFFDAVERMVNHSAIAGQNEQLEVLLRAKSALNELALRVTLEDLEAFTELFGHGKACSEFLAVLNVEFPNVDQSDIDAVRVPYGEHFNHCINIARRHQLGASSSWARVGGVFLQLTRSDGTEGTNEVEDQVLSDEQA